MLQRVALGQVRFNLPGLAVDGRGVVGGRQLAVRVSSVDRMVAFFRALAAEQNLDDLQPGLRIVYARAAAGTREAVVFLPGGVSAASLGDVVARAARLAGGQCFTGTGRHFVQMRDAAAPLGYDAAAPSRAPGDFILYGAEHDSAYTVDSELPLGKLLLRLSLQRRAGEDTWPSDGPLLLVVRRGLGPLVAEALERARAVGARIGSPGDGGPRAWAALVEASGGATFSSFSTARTLWLFKVEAVPARLRGLFTRTPGIDAYVPVGETVGVALGYRHPIALESCRGAFPADRLTLFSPRPDGALDIAPRPVLTPVEDVVRLRAPAVVPERRAARGGGHAEVTTPLRLEASAEGRRPPVAALVPWARVPWLGRLCYALPAPALRGIRVAALERGVLVLARPALEGFPFGVLLEAAAPDVLVPVGTRLRPAVTPEGLAERLGAEGGTVVVFPALGAEPFRVDAGAFTPLDRAAIAALEKAPLASLATVDGPAQASAPIEIENDPLGPMPLWGLER